MSNIKFNDYSTDSLKLEYEQVILLINISKKKNKKVIVSYDKFTETILYFILILIHTLPYNTTFLIWEIQEKTSMYKEEYSIEDRVDDSERIIYYTYLGQLLGIFIILLITSDTSKSKRSRYVFPKRIILINLLLFSIGYFILYMNIYSMSVLYIFLFTINISYILIFSSINTYLIDITLNPFYTICIIFLMKNISGIYTITSEIIKEKLYLSFQLQYLFNSLLFFIILILFYKFVSDPILLLYSNGRHLDVILEIERIASFNKNLEEVKTVLFEIMPVELNVIHLLNHEMMSIQDDDFYITSSKLANSSQFLTGDEKENGKNQSFQHKKLYNDGNRDVKNNMRTENLSNSYKSYKDREKFNINSDFSKNRKEVNMLALYPFLNENSIYNSSQNTNNDIINSIDYFNTEKDFYEEKSVGRLNNLLKRVKSSLIRILFSLKKQVKTSQTRKILIYSFLYRVIYQYLFYWTQISFTTQKNLTYNSLFLIYIFEFLSYFLLFFYIFYINPQINYSAICSKYIKVCMYILFTLRILLEVLFYTEDYMIALYLTMILIRSTLSIFNLLINIYFLLNINISKNLNLHNTSKFLCRILLLFSNGLYICFNSFGFSFYYIEILVLLSIFV